MKPLPPLLTIPLLALFAATSAFAGLADHTLDIYWVDVEGGGATLIVTPTGESILIDSGNPFERDPGRIHKVATEAAGLKKIDHRLIGWSWMLWDWNWFRQRTSESVVARVLGRANAGDIVVMHDGDESAPLADQRYTVEATARLIPALRAKGFAFGTICN